MPPDNPSPKQRVRVTARRSNVLDPAFTTDAFQNAVAGVGVGSNNPLTASTYGFTPISRNHVLLEWMYRGSWLVKKVVDVVADDMTRAGIHFASDIPPDDSSKLHQYLNTLMVWPALNATLKWSRLYGGAGAIIVIDGQDFATPLKPESVGKGQFKGLIPVDRWMLWPSMSETVKDFGPNFGKPEFYQVTADARTIPQWKIHYSRLIRIDGVELPYWQKIAENGWGLSVIEPMFDRQVAFDSATMGAAQLVFKAHLRTVSVDGLRTALAAGGPGGVAAKGLMQYFGMIRLLQNNEGLTILDSKDTFQTYQYSFGGLSDILIQLGQQISGAVDIPLVRLFGQSPAGLSATGESDIRNYYDFINAQQVARLHQPILKVLDIAHRSLFGSGKKLPDGFDVSFNPLWQLTPEQKAGVAKTVLDSVSIAFQEGLIDQATALKELRESSKQTGIFTNITDEMITEAENAPPMPMFEMPGEAQGQGQEQGVKMEPPKGDPSRSEMKEKDTGDALPDRPIVWMTDVTQYPMRDFQGLTIVVETEKGQQRIGYGWTNNMPSDYGYISGTSSAEGPLEQMDCFIGPDENSVMVWVIDQVDPNSKVFDEHKTFLGFTSRTDVIETYQAAFNDGRGNDRIGGIKAMSIDTFKDWLKNYKYEMKRAEKVEPATA